jgi:aminoglycoside phosphotransferase family enzyme
VLATPDPDVEPTLAEKVAFLGGAAFPGQQVGRRETHMSWVFFVGDEVYKLKKPVRWPYLDFSTWERREAACRAEVALNQVLAPKVYLGVVALVAKAGRLSLGGPGRMVDWLVRMRRLDETLTLESRLKVGGASSLAVPELGARLARFYWRAPRVRRSATRALVEWRAAVELNAKVLLDPRLPVPRGAVRAAVAAQRRFLRRKGHLLAARARARRILDAHGDLRPEHIWLGEPLCVIDRLEFSAALRSVDPADELALLEVETAFLGAPSVGLRVREHVLAAMHDKPPDALLMFYRSARALLRARLTIAHLLEPDPRTPEVWAPRARRYLALGLRDAKALSVRLRTPAGR